MSAKPLQERARQHSRFTREVRPKTVNRTPFKQSSVIGLDLQLPLALAGARASTRFARLCALQRHLASASKSVFNLSINLPRTTSPHTGGSEESRQLSQLGNNTPSLRFDQLSRIPLATHPNRHISNNTYPCTYSCVAHRIYKDDPFSFC
jgi:hypothetical protein